MSDPRDEALRLARDVGDLIERLRDYAENEAYGPLRGALGEAVNRIRAQDEERAHMTARIAELEAEVAELTDMNSDRNDIEHERDEYRNSSRHYAAEVARLREALGRIAVADPDRLNAATARQATNATGAIARAALAAPGTGDAER